MPKVSKGERAVTPGDLDSARRYLGAIRTTTRDPMVFFDKVRKADIVGALSAMSWYLDQLPEGFGYEYMAAAAHMAKSAKVKDMSAVAVAVRDVDKSKLVKYMDGPLLHDDSVYTSSQWRVPIKGRDVAYSAPDVSAICSPATAGTASAGTEHPVAAGDRGSGEDGEEEDSLAPPGGQVPSAQDAGGGPGASSSSSNGDNGNSSDGGNSVIPDGKVSGFSSNSVRSLAAPNQLTFGPQAKAGMGGLVDKGTDGSGAARAGGVEGGDVDGVTGADRRVKEAPFHGTPAGSLWRPRVCNRVWKGKICKNRSSGCRFAHPDPCNSNKCSGSPAAGCKAFHPRVGGVETSVVMGNGRGSVRRGGAAPNGSRRNKASRPNSSSNNRRTAEESGGNRGGGSRSSGNNNTPSSSSSSSLRRPQVSYRDMAARAVPSASGSNNNDNSSIPRFRAPPARVGGDFAHAPPDPAMLSAVVAAVMAVLSGGKQLF